MTELQLTAESAALIEAICENVVTKVLTAFEAKVMQALEDRIQMERPWALDKIDAASDAHAKAINDLNTRLKSTEITVSKRTDAVQKLDRAVDRLELAAKSLETQHAQNKQEIEALKATQTELAQEQAVTHVRLAGIEEDMMGSAAHPNKPNLRQDIKDTRFATDEVKKVAEEGLQVARDGKQVSEDNQKTLAELNARLGPLVEFSALLKTERENAKLQAAERTKRRSEQWMSIRKVFIKLGGALTIKAIFWTLSAVGITGVVIAAIGPYVQQIVDAVLVLLSGG